jgi:hypothetical protein
MNTYLAYDIQWDTDGEEVDLPDQLTVEAADEDELADEISNITGFCHYGFKIKMLEQG